MRLALRLLMLALSLVLALAACPKLPPVSGCTPLTYHCVNGSPFVCSSSMRLEPIGDRSCASVGAVCVVERTAHCAPAVDAGADASEVSP